MSAPHTAAAARAGGIAEKILAPGVMLTSRLTFAKKFTVVGCVMVAALGYVVATYLGQKGTEIGFSAKERVGVQYLTPAADLLRTVVDARTVAVSAAAGDRAAQGQLGPSADAVRAALAKVAAVDRGGASSLGLTGELSKTGAAVEGVLGGSYASARAAYDAYNGAATAVLDLIVGAGNNSNLILDPDLDSFYLMDNAVNKLPLMMDTAGRVADLQTVIAHGADRVDQRIQLAVLQGALATTLGQAKAGFATAYDTTADGAVRTKLEPLMKSTESAVGAVLAKAKIGVSGASTPDSRSEGSSAVARTAGVAAANVPLLDHLLVTRIGGFTSERDLVLAIALLGAVLAIYLFVALFVSVRRSVEALGAAMAAAGEGDLTAEAPAVGNDELARIGRAFGEMLGGLRSTVEQVSTSAATVAQASRAMAATSEETGRAVGEIAAAVGEVAEGAERQVRAVETARCRTEQVAETAEASALNARETAEAAVRAREVSNEGSQAVERAGEAMAAVRGASRDITSAISMLGSKSEEIGGIVATITGIAEQTNLLALNAAIEAARAGEQGRGFAVVAEEVRKLAEESQTAAASISTLISEIQEDTRRVVGVVENGARMTEDSVAVVEQARDAFLRIGSAVEDVSHGVSYVATAIEEIAVASAQTQEQIGEVAVVAEQSSAATEEVSASTQETSASAEEIAASAQDLARTAASLQELVGRFRIAA